MRALAAIAALSALAAAGGAALMTQSEIPPSFSDAGAGGDPAHGPWPPQFARDPSNRVSGNPAAIALGKQLFSDARLSKDGRRSCTTCHDPVRFFADGRDRSLGLARVDRNAIALANLRLNRWFGWAGAADSLWGQSLRPILDEKEALGATAGRARAARRSTLRSPRTMPACSARRWPQTRPTSRWSTWPGRWRPTRSLCDGPHSVRRVPRRVHEGRQGGNGPLSGRGATWLEDLRRQGPVLGLPLRREFHQRRVRRRGRALLCGEGPRGPGPPRRHRRAAREPFNLLGRYNDDPSTATAEPTRHVEPQHRNWGEFRVPSLRNVANTAPYMHNGSLSTLEAVVRHYSEVDVERLHGDDGARLVRPLRLSPQETADLVVFLETLSGPLSHTQ